MIAIEAGGRDLIMDEDLNISGRSIESYKFSPLREEERIEYDIRSENGELAKWLIMGVREPYRTAPSGLQPENNQ